MKITQNIKAVIFDLDGLLINSEVIWDKTDMILLNKRGITPTSELFLKRLGTGHTPTIKLYKKKFGIKDSVESLSTERLDIFYEILWKNLSLMDGAEELIKNLKAKRLVLAIATGGHNQEKLTRILKQLGIFNFFSVLVNGYQVKNQKPYPDIFLYAARELGVDPAVCLVFEDAPSGIQAAKTAGMMAWGVNKNVFARDEMEKAGADEVFAILAEITT